MNNITRTEQVIAWLEQWGCFEVVVCAGARNAPLVMALHQITGLKVWSFFEERSAAFFALGRMKSGAGPVAVVTTSGTAAAELLPATIEAHYTGLPLILVTADRPPEFRGTGAPQAIEQVGLFSCYVEKSLDAYDQGPSLSTTWSKTRPIHLNVCFDEPTQQDLQKLSLKAAANFKPLRAASAMRAASLDGKNKIQNFCSQSAKPLVIAGPMSVEEAEHVKVWLRATRLPVFLEALSNLSHCESLREQQVVGTDRLLQTAFKNTWVDGVIRVGGVPTLRFWRDLEVNLKNTPVISFSDLPFSGLSRTDAPILPLCDLQNWPKNLTANIDPLWRSRQFAAKEKLDQLLNEFPDSEPALVRALAKSIPDRANVYLGNSLPVREWDLAANGLKHWNLSASRGANGIDGQLSTFLGWADQDKSNWCVVGDLTALYDLSAPWVLNQRPDLPITLVIINNGGGKIFSRMYGRKELENHHQIGFQDWAKMWNLPYQRCRSGQDLQAVATAPQRVLELIPNFEQNQKFWAAWDLFWKSE